MTMLIKGMEMPPKGQGRMFLYDDNTAIWLNLDTGERIAYEVIPVPTPHGRLIDEKWIKEYITDTAKGFEEMNRSDLQNYSLIAGLRTVEVMIEHAPTIIEAEE